MSSVLTLPERPPDTQEHGRAALAKSIVKEADVERLGDGAFTYQGDEYQIVATVSDVAAFSASDGQVFVPVAVSEGTDEKGRAITVTRYQRGLRVAAGTYTAAQAKVARVQRSEALRPVDSLGILPLLAGSRDRIVPLGKPSSGDVLDATYGTPADAALAAEMLTRLTPRSPGAMLVPARPPAIGPEAILERLRRKGVEVSARGGYLLVRSPKGRLDIGLREAIEAAAPLLIPFLEGKPLACVLSHTGTVPADTLGLAGLPLCQGHASGELEP